MKILVSTLLICASLLAASARAQLLLTIDVSDITNITFTPTSNFPAIADNSFTGEEGFTLIGLIANETDSEISFKTGSTLKADGIGAYTDIKGVNFSSTNEDDFESGFDLLVFRFEELALQNFSLSLAAFTGAAQVDLFQNNIVLKTSGGGDIFLGGTPGRKGDKIGEYQVIPEPGTFALFGLGLLGATVAALRGHRSQLADPTRIP